MNDFIPVNRPDLSDLEQGYLSECIDTFWISSKGSFVERFETELLCRVVCQHGIVVANGSMALYLAVAAIWVGLGDDVIMPTFNIISCAAEVVRANAKPVFVDSDPSTWNMDVGQIAQRITHDKDAVEIQVRLGIVGLAPASVRLVPIVSISIRINF